MAWAGLNTLGTAQNKTSGTSLAITTSAAAEAGHVVILAVASDNTSTTDGDNGETTTPTDSAGGNTWTKLREFTNGQGAAAAGATIAVWYSILTNQINNGGTITANWASARVAKAISAWEFTIGAGNTISVAGQLDTPYDALAPASETLSGLTSGEYLFFRANAGEGTSGTWTATTNYTAITIQQSSGTPNASNMIVAGEFHVFTGTGDTSTPTTNYGALDSSDVYLAILESSAITLLGAAMV